MRLQQRRLETLDKAAHVQTVHHRVVHFHRQGHPQVLALGIDAAKGDLRHGVVNTPARALE